MAKVTKEKFKVYKNVFDNATIENLHKLASRGFFEELYSPISIGKESNVFSAITKDESFIVAKIYRVENCNFNKMYTYISQDPRFITIKNQRRKVIFSWVQRESRNLFKARDAGINVPQVLAIKDNVILLDLIGHTEQHGDITKPVASPQLKDAKLEDPKKMADHVLRDLKKMATHGLVHGDLSGFNILVKNKQPYFIDFSQATTKENTEYLKLWARDIINICNFFTRRGVKLDAKDTFKDITGKNFPVNLELDF